jgi:hypothetical protein
MQYDAFLIIRPTVCTNPLHKQYCPLSYMFRQSTAIRMEQHKYLKPKKASYTYNNKVCHSHRRLLRCLQNTSAHCVCD